MQKSLIILLVDDDPDCRTLSADAISQGCPFTETRDVAGGQEALDFLSRRNDFANAPRPDMIFTDLEMPEISGLDLLKVVKSDPDVKEIPVVVLTGVTDKEQRRLAEENGAYAYTQKSADPEALRRAVVEPIARWMLKVRKKPDYTPLPHARTAKGS